MPRRRRRHPNWPYRLAWLGVLLAIVAYVGVRTVVTATTFGRRSYGIDWGLAIVASCFDATIAIFFFVVGASIGSFLNVVAYRLPLGRFLGGHSGCPYCRAPIASFDNVPILAWIKLRGRCRTCRLPISMQYPLVELSVAMVFLTVYLSELVSGGNNLPSTLASQAGGGVLRLAVTPELVMRLVSYLFALSSLIGAALIALKRQRIPLALFAWSIVPLLGMSLVLPSVVVVPWRTAVPSGAVESRLDAILSLICGAVTAIAVARLIAPIAYRGFDRSLLGADPKSVGARQFIVAMAAAGSIVGWQSVVPLAWSVVSCGLIAVALLRFFFDSGLRVQTSSNRLNLGDLTVWVWLGLLVFRANWSGLLELQLMPGFFPQVLRHVLGAIAIAPLAGVFNWLANPRIVEPEHEQPQLSEVSPQNTP